MIQKPYFGMQYDHRISLNILGEGFISHKRKFLALTPSLIKTWEGIEATPFTKTMLQILEKGTRLVQKKVNEYEVFSLYETEEAT